jgi:hypothetical protein
LIAFTTEQKQKDQHQESDGRQFKRPGNPAGPEIYIPSWHFPQLFSLGMVFHAPLVRSVSHKEGMHAIPSLSAFVVLLGRS